MVIFRELSVGEVIEAAVATVRFTAQILVIVACAGVFAWLLTVNQVPATLVSWIKYLEVTPWQFLLVVNVLLLIVGCFLDPLSAILLLTPLLVPIAKALGIDTVHFGIVFTVNLAIGLFHPPFGINIFVAQSVLGIRLETIYRGILPFVLLYLIVLVLITYVPDISLYWRASVVQLNQNRPRERRHIYAFNLGTSLIAFSLPIALRSAAGSPSSSRFFIWSSPKYG